MAVDGRRRPALTNTESLKSEVSSDFRLRFQASHNRSRGRTGDAWLRAERFQELLDPLPVQHLALPVLLKSGTIPIASRHLHLSVRASRAGRRLTTVTLGCERRMRPGTGPKLGRSARTRHVTDALLETLAGSVLGDRIHYTRSVTLSLWKGERRGAKL